MSDFSWATWVEVSKGTAERLGLTKDKGIEITSSNGHTFTAGWQMSPGIADDTFAISSAGGQVNRGRYAKVAAENGGSALALIDFNTDAHGAVQFVGNATIKASTARNAPSPRNKLLKSDTLTMNDRGANYTVYKGDLGTKEGASSIVPMHRLPDSSMAIRSRHTKSRFNPEEFLTDMYPEPEHPVHRFVMAFDLNRCNGCGACEVACYAENNIPVTGPEEARLGRRMSWDRLSVFWEGDGETPDIRFQPNTCQQCSHAPCEGVCPVLATYHNIDGLNAMVYNRCVGTRYCGNNCPYSSRRFNYHTYRWPESFNLMLNPDVMTREMGVMEKCTFCVQRIRAAKDEHRDNVGFAGQGTAVPEDKLMYLTACSQTCPTDAIRFGNLNDKESAVAKAFEEPRGYKLLEELNTKPAIVYLARIVHEKSEQWEHSFGHHGGHGGGHGDGHDDGHGSNDNGHHGDEHNGTESNGH
jgi:molybdopterin-containing oxidoreductase family iron-sulfur binding subunit